VIVDGYGSDMDKPFFTGRNGSAWFVALLGGVQRRGPWRMARDMVVVTPLGGANLDLTEAELVDPQSTTLTKVSLVGGVSLVVPHDMDVEVEGFRLFGGVRVEPARRTGPATAALKVRGYGLAGGVDVRRAG
jgi:Cell wall-active antibiotics response 4TMS YvqF